MADPRSKPRHLPAQRDRQTADLRPTGADPAEPGTRQVSLPPAAERGLRWPWLLADCGILTVSSLVAGLGILGLTMMWLIANRLHGADRANLQIDAIKYGLGFIAAGGAAAALLLSVRRQQLAERSHDLELRKQDLERRKQEHAEGDAADRRITELYTKAVEQLGSGDAAVRLGGLYALERVAQNNPDQRQTVVDVICAYLRMPYTPPAKPNPGRQADNEMAGTPSGTTTTGTASARDPRQELQVRLTAQRILTKHLHAAHLRPRRGIALDDDFDEPAPDPALQFWPRTDLDLTGATLVGWKFSGCAARDAYFAEATFTGEAKFSEASFTGDATFKEAVFAGDAWFNRATFSSDATFKEVVFAGDAWFDRATFTSDALFDTTTFTGGAWFNKATFTCDALFYSATFTSDAEFNQAVFPRGAKAFGFDGCRITNRGDRRDNWPDGWSVKPGTEYGTLEYKAAGPQPVAGADAGP